MNEHHDSEKILHKWYHDVSLPKIFLPKRMKDFVMRKLYPRLFPDPTETRKSFEFVLVPK